MSRPAWSYTDTIASRTQSMHLSEAARLFGYMQFHHVRASPMPTPKQSISVWMQLSGPRKPYNGDPNGLWSGSNRNFVATRNQSGRPGKCLRSSTIEADKEIFMRTGRWMTRSPPRLVRTPSRARSRATPSPARTPGWARNRLHPV